MNKTVKCPTCKTSVTWSKDAIYRPFCSERCRLIDLGEWANEGHALPGPSSEQGFDLPDENSAFEDSQY